MKTHPVLPAAALLAALCASPAARAQPPPPAATPGLPAPAPLSAAEPAAAQPAVPGDLRTLLRDALFEEEATRDLTKAAAGYEALLAQWDAQRPLAAAALYRLAEVRRKQDRKADAIALYQRLLRDFSDVEPHARLSRENLNALGAKEPVPAASPDFPPALSDAESATIARLTKLAAESPDLLVGEEFTKACGLGQINVVRFLLGKSVTDKGEGLRDAAGNGHLAVVRELLTQKPLPAHLHLALSQAAGFGRAAVVRLLLENGAPPDDPDSAISPLCMAISAGHDEIADLLLTARASVNPAKATHSPLYLAVQTGDEALVQRLLASGADANRGIAPSETLRPRPNAPPRNSDSPWYNAKVRDSGSTPLHRAAGGRDQGIIDLLLAAKADPNAPDDYGWTPLHVAAVNSELVTIEKLLAAGASPNPPLVLAAQTRTPLFLAANAVYQDNSKGTAAVAALLKSKADPNATLEGVPALLAAGIRRPELRDSLLAMSLEAGADPEVIINNSETSVRVPLMRSHRFPKLAEEPVITLSVGHIAFQETIARRGSQEENPASLPSLLISWSEKRGDEHYNSSAPDWRTLRIWRKGEGGKLSDTAINLTPGVTFPALQWGDIIEILSSDWDKPMSLPSPNPQPGNERPTWMLKLPSEVLAILRGGQSARVTFKSDGFTKDLTLRGVLRTYDLATGEAPLLPLNTLIPLLAGSRPGMVKIERTAERGGGTVEWSTSSGSGTALPEEGDTITFTPDAPDASAPRVSLRIPGQPGVWQNAGTDQYPTLLQFLCDHYIGLPCYQVLPPDSQGRDQRAAALKALTPEQLVTNLITSGGPVLHRPQLAWPDWSGVKVRRASISGIRLVEQRDGKPVEVVHKAIEWGESEPVDLLAAMNSLTAESTPEEARKFDIQLKPGDEVELPLLKDHPPGPWPGFDEAALRLFTKALTAKVTVVDPDGRFREATLQWLPPRWLPTAAGVLPVPDGDASGGRTYWPRARDFADSVAPGLAVARVVREGKSLEERVEGDSGEVFLRPGDTLHLRNSPPSAQPMQSIPPSRVVIPPAGQ